MALVTMTNIHEMYSAQMALSSKSLRRLTIALQMAIEATPYNRLSEGYFELGTQPLTALGRPADEQLLFLLERKVYADQVRFDGFPTRDQIASVTTALNLAAKSSCTLYPSCCYKHMRQYPLPTGIYTYAYDDVLHPLVMVLNSVETQFYAAFAPNSCDYDSAQHQHYTAMWLFYTVAQTISALRGRNDKLLAYGAAGLPSGNQQEGVATHICSCPEGVLLPLDLEDDSHSYRQMNHAVLDWRATPMASVLEKLASKRSRKRP